MNKKIVYILILIFVLTTTVVYGGIYRKESISNFIRIDSKEDNLIEYRFHDDEMNVTCWLEGSGNFNVPYSISCLPDYMLNKPNNYLELIK